MLILMIDIDLLGLVYWWGLSINAITICIIVMSIGLAVDYNVHIVHCWLTVTEKEGKSRIVLAMDEIGVSVLHGAISTFLAVIIMAFGKNFVFEVFFKLFIGIILYGVSHGLILCPIILSFLNRKNY